MQLGMIGLGRMGSNMVQRLTRGRHECVVHDVRATAVADVGNLSRAIDAETTPMRDPAFYQYSFDLPEIAELWRRGSIIGSWLLDLTAGALLDPVLANRQIALPYEPGTWGPKAADDLVAGLGGRQNPLSEQRGGNTGYP